MTGGADKIVVLGGYGAVGRVVASSLARQFPGKVFVAGRSRQAAEAFARTSGGAILPLALDAADPGQLAGALDGARVVVECVGRDDVGLARACLERGVHYVDISASAPFLRQVELLDPLARQHGAAAALSVGLAPGLTNLLAKHCVERLGAVDTLDIGILLGLGEAHGAAAIRWTLERMVTPFTLWRDGVAVPVAGFDTARQLRFPGRYGWRWAYRFDFADQHIIVRTLGLPRVSTWLCFDSAMVTRAVGLLRRVGALRALRRASVRDRLAALLARVHIGSNGFAISVMARRGKSPLYTCGLSGRGQSHATGLVAALVAGQLYTTDGLPGVFHIEQRLNPDAVFKQLGAEGISVTLDAPPAR
jgi:saccharopine dehydrogenase (NAD+, L-lysine-forming)